MTTQKLDPEKLGKLCGTLVSAGVSLKDIGNILWLLKHRQRLEWVFMLWVREN